MQEKKHFFLLFLDNERRVALIGSCADYAPIHSFFFKNPFAPVIPYYCLLASELVVSNKAE